MLAVVLIGLLVVPLLLVVVCILFGFRMGGEHWQRELSRVKLEAAQAERQLHQLTKQAFIAMQDHVHRLPRDGQR